MPALPTSQRVHNDEDEDGGEEDDMGSKCQHTQGTAARPKSQRVKDDECEYNNDDEGDRRWHCRHKRSTSNLPTSERTQADEDEGPVYPSDSDLQNDARTKHFL